MTRMMSAMFAPCARTWAKQVVASSQALTSQSEDGESLSGEEDERGGGEMGEGCGAVRGGEGMAFV